MMNGGGRGYMAHRRWYLHAEFWFKNVEEGEDHAADLGVEGSVIVHCFIQRMGCR
jgi:hypothetical protein